MDQAIPIPSDIDEVLREFIDNKIAYFVQLQAGLSFSRLANRKNLTGLNIELI